MSTRIESTYKKDKILFDLTHKSKNLYNYANYIIRQEFINTTKQVEIKEREHAIWLRYNDIYNLIKEDVDFKSLPAQTSQAILRRLDSNWKSFFKSIKDWKKNPQKYKAKPSLPKYKDKKGYFLTVYPGQNLSIKDDYIIIPKTDGYKIKTKVKKEDLKELRLVPVANKIKIEIVYQKKIKPTNKNKERKLSIDIGVNNLMAITSNQENISSCLINGRPVKSINQFYNKTLAQRKSILEKVNGKKTSCFLKKLSFKREMKINDYFHKASRWLVEFANENDIGQIVIGKNKDWKQEVNFWKKDNQNFVQIPFCRLIQQIKYKAEEYGIEVIEQEESYTSKCDHLAFEEMKHQEKYLGKRIKRGMFKSSTGKIINADVNGAIGILRKVSGNCFIKNIVSRGNVFLPYKLCF